MAARKPFLLRIDSGLWNDLEAWAQEDLRSVNGQIEYLLRQAVQKRRGNRQASGNPPGQPAAPDVAPDVSDSTDTTTT